MKQAFTWLIVITLLFSLAGCGLNRAEKTIYGIMQLIRQT